ncbi:cytochrome P450 oxidoreductase GliC [Corynespora cassiicola Philippines]|uniref:Cytochrome P450 oxidoreductase GliC n=1 Tax=Corynespora cassiicola Philippines TaxID=1448308 RepID=A0A2T2NVR9_CORCC|nr:cytochrome P450 oxidoreductase GliC [Corynespora cassiicola Philippines]
MISALMALLLCIWKRESVKNSAISVLSRVIEIILLCLRPIKHKENGSYLPSLPYTFPNGQGNVEKFLHGRSNSAKWAREYGPLYRLWSGTTSEVVLTKSEHVKAVFLDSDTHEKAPANGSGELMNQLLGSCLGLISGAPWKKLKAAVKSPFLHKSAALYVGNVQEFTKEYMKQLTAENADFRERGLLHPVRDLKMAPFMFVATVIYGELSAEDQSELLDMIPQRERLFKNVISGGITRFKFAQYLPLPAVRELHEFKARWAAWNDRVYAQALKKEQSDNTLPPIFAMRHSLASGDITRDHLLQTLDEALFANLDVTMGALSWPLLLGACLLEASRLRPLAAFSVPQSCPSARELDGFEVPAGTRMVVDSYALNVRDPFWGEDRELFRPGRWLGRLQGELRYRYWRFGFGPRTCLGRYVADLILRSVVVEVVENWRVSMEFGGKKAVGMDWPWDDESWIHHPDLMLKCVPVS